MENTEEKFIANPDEIYFRGGMKNIDIRIWARNNYRYITENDTRVFNPHFPDPTSNRGFRAYKAIDIPEKYLLTKINVHSTNLLDQERITPIEINKFK